METAQLAYLSDKTAACREVPAFDNQVCLTVFLRPLVHTFYDELFPAVRLPSLLCPAATRSPKTAEQDSSELIVPDYHIED